MRADDLAGRDDAHLAEYVRGLRDEGCDIPEPVVRRSHALHLLLMSGLSALPDELLDRDPFDPEVVTLSTDRAAIARFCLDRVRGDRRVHLSMASSTASVAAEWSRARTGERDGY